MFRVEIRGLGAASEDLQKSITKLNRQIQETEDIISSIRRIEAYYDVIRYLRNQLENLKTEKKQMMDLRAAMEQIQQIYMRAEQNITEYGEEIHRLNYYRSMNVISLNSIHNQILDYNIR